MLPSFRVRGVRPVEDPSSTRGKVAADGIIRLKKQDYDELLKREPEAALRYLDEDDGEVILVGSGFELDQRLKEPIGFDSAAGIGARLKGDGPMHTFEVERQPAVVDLWTQLDAQTQCQREQAGRARVVEGKKKMTLDQFDTLDRAKDIRFGQASPLSLNAPVISTPALNDDEHTNRWSSYVTLPSSFDQKPHEVKQHVDGSNGFRHPTNVSNQGTQNSNSSTNTVSNLLEQIKFTATQREALNNQINSGHHLRTFKKDASEHQPLLKIFESDLQKLAPASTQSISNVNSTGVQTTNSTASTKNASTSTYSTPPTTSTDQVGQSGQNSIAESVPRTSDSIVAEGFISLLTGVTLLAKGLAQPSKGSRSPLDALYQEVPRQLRQLKSKVESEVPWLNQVPSSAPRSQSSSRSSHTHENQPEGLVDRTEVKPSSIEKIQNSIAEDIRQENSCCVEDNSNSTPDHQPKLSPGPAFKQWKVARIVGKRFIRYNSGTGPCIVQYLVRWVDCGPSEDVWYDEENLLDCRVHIQNFEAESIRESMNFRESNACAETLRQRQIKEAQQAAELHIRTAGEGMIVWKERCRPSCTDANASLQGKDQKVTFADQSSIVQKNDIPPVNQGSGLGELLVKHVNAARAGKLKQLIKEEQAKALSERVQGSTKMPTEFPSKQSVTNDAIRRNLAELKGEVPTASERASLRQWHPSQSESSTSRFALNEGALAETSGLEPPQKKLQHRQSWHSNYARVDDARRQIAFSSFPRTNTAATVSAAPARLSKLGAQVVARSEPSSGQGNSFAPRRARSMTFNPGTQISASAPPIEPWRVSPPSMVQRSVTTNEARSASRKGILKKPSFADSLKFSSPSIPGQIEAPILTPVSFGSRTENNIAECVDNMIGMGFTRSQAETVAIEVGGDLIKAIDLMEEDRRAWETEMRNTPAVPVRPNEPLPGSWDEELYG